MWKNKKFLGGAKGRELVSGRYSSSVPTYKGGRLTQNTIDRQKKRVKKETPAGYRRQRMLTGSIKCCHSRNIPAF